MRLVFNNLMVCLFLLILSLISLIIFLSLLFNPLHRNFLGLLLGLDHLPFDSNALIFFLRFNYLSLPNIDLLFPFLTILTINHLERGIIIWLMRLLLLFFICWIAVSTALFNLFRRVLLLRHTTLFLLFINGTLHIVRDVGLRLLLTLALLLSFLLLLGFMLLHIGLHLGIIVVFRGGIVFTAFLSLLLHDVVFIFLLRHIIWILYLLLMRTLFFALFLQAFTLNF